MIESDVRTFESADSTQMPFRVLLTERDLYLASEKWTESGSPPESLNALLTQVAMVAFDVVDRMVPRAKKVLDVHVPTQFGFMFRDAMEDGKINTLKFAEDIRTYVESLPAGTFLPNQEPFPFDAKEGAA